MLPAAMQNTTLKSSVGTLPWARRTLGALGASDRLALAGQAIRLQGFLASSLLFRRNRIRIDIAEIRTPDSALARKAADLCAAVSPEQLVNHCCRAYLWSRLFADAYGITFDDELLYAACMLHDLGLTSAYDNCARHGECFTLDSVEGASAWAKDAGWDAARQDALAEAILLHMNVKVGIEQGAEAHLLHEAAGLDCLGLRAWEIERATRDAVVSRHPRDRFKPFLIETFSAQARKRPNCRAAFLIRYLLFRPMIRLAPFADAP
ncbi:MAG: HD domain-containing protein [Candidatus Hydrogenedentes bacterium]|nr:HD domain-containing protein [Candidatus Hydrogenedentota bacterium]